MQRGISLEDQLRSDLARADRQAGSRAPLLRQLLANQDNSLFSDEIVARVRGMLAHLARQLIIARSEEMQDGDWQSAVDAYGEELQAILLADGELIAHLHALALEWQLLHRLELRNSVDPVLGQVLQGVISSHDTTSSRLGMAALAAMARFSQQQLRMELPLQELPGDLFHSVLQGFKACFDDGRDPHAVRAVEGLRRKYDESRSRIGLLTRLVMGQGDLSTDVFSVEHAGASLFLSAVAFGSGLERDLVLLSTNDGQMIRLALAMRAAGMPTGEVIRQVYAIQPDFLLPAEFSRLSAMRAMDLLHSSSLEQVA